MKIRSINKWIAASLFFIMLALDASAQELITVKGTVYSADAKKTLPDVQIYSMHAKRTVISDSTGAFSIQVNDRYAQLRFTLPGYQVEEIPLNGRTEVKIFLLPEKSFMYSSQYYSPEGKLNTQGKPGTAQSLEQKDFSSGFATPDDAINGRLAGLRVVNKSGMPGEGALVQLRGLRSLTAENTPLIVVDGVPYLPDLKSSSVIDGFSRSMFMPVNMKDVSNITLLKGADAAAYGSLGSNGVLMIETERSQATATEVQIHTTEGVGFMKRRFPVLNATDFKSYMSDLGETYYSDLNELTTAFPFLKDDPTYAGNYKYAHNTDWQEEIYQPSITSENTLKVMGGDAIAKYALSVGYLYNRGVIEGTSQSKYNTRLNADINVSKNFDILANAVFNYGEYKLQEQGILKKTSPLITALSQAPVLSVYEQDREFNNLPHLNKTVELFGISNPKAVVSDIEGKNKSYDVLVDLGFKYRLLPQLSLSAFVGLYYSYSKESMFVPGNTSGALAFLEDGFEGNTIRSGVGERLNYYLKGSADYRKTFRNIHDLSATLGYQLISSRREYDKAQGLSVQSDFYKTLSYSAGSTSIFGAKTDGYIDKWNWMNAYLTAKYGYKSQLYATFTLGIDAASPYGKSNGRVAVLPSAQIAWNIKNAPFLINSESVSALTLRGEYGMLANSRFSAKYGSYYYHTVPYRDLAGTMREGLPNSWIGPEKILSSNIGVDFALLGNRINLSADLYEERTKDLLLDRDKAAAYGHAFMYQNDGELKTQGAELTLNVNIFQNGKFKWTVGGNIAHYKTEVVSLGGMQEKLYTSEDGTTLISRVGETPFSFYGHQMEKVFCSQNEINSNKYVSHSGRAFEVGDVKFSDLNGDRIINDDDRLILGDPNPDFYGGFYSNMSYRGFGLFINFAYSYGNDIYNAVRRNSESMSEFSNQFSTVVNRWMVEGQQTDMPRAAYGDPLGNSRFSSRWIEDGSYLRVKEITLSYETAKKVWFFDRLKVYVTGENLFTWTKYIGLDPEFSYSYDPMLFGVDLGKVPLAKSAKVGLILNF